MGTITVRKRKNGSSGFTAQIRIKRAGKVVHTEAQTFDRRVSATAWLRKRETELDDPRAILGKKARTGDTHTLRDAIGKYIESQPAMGRTKKQVLRTLLSFDVVDLPCAEIKSSDLSQLIAELGRGRKPQTVGNYMSHLQAVFTVANDAWQMPLDEDEMSKAIKAGRRLHLVTKSERRDRRPTLAELDALLEHFSEVELKRPAAMPMSRIIAFAIFSTRRQEEITTIRKADYEGDRVLVRNMKHPGQKVGNHVWCDLVPESRQIVDSMKGKEAEIFPYNSKSVGSNFTRACQLLGIVDLRFHDLRHDGVSRLFEMGWTIPQVAQVSGHRSWSSLSRYTHMRQTGDKYLDWKWLPILTDKPLPHRSPESD